MTGTNCRNHWSWRLISPSLTLSISCQSSLQITAPVHSPSVNSPPSYLIPILLFIYLFASLHPSTSTCTFIFCTSITLVFKLISHYGLPYRYDLTSFAHTVYRLFYFVIDCMFVYSMCNTVLLFMSHCFALSWPGLSCKWELVLKWPTWLNKGEINK